TPSSASSSHREPAESMQPEFDVFRERYEAGAAQIVYDRVVADLETRVGTYLKLTGEAPFSFLLESVEGGATRGRYSMIGMEPDLLWRVRDGRAEVNRSAAADPGAFAPMDGHPLDALRTLLAESRITLPPELPTNAAGVYGYLGYD